MNRSKHTSSSACQFALFVELRSIWRHSKLSGALRSSCLVLSVLRVPRAPSRHYRDARLAAKLAMGRTLRVALPAVVGMFGMAVDREPSEKRANATVRQGNTGIGRAVVEVNGVTV